MLRVKQKLSWTLWCNRHWQSLACLSTVVLCLFGYCETQKLRWHSSRNWGNWKYKKDKKSRENMNYRTKENKQNISREKLKSSFRARMKKGNNREGSVRVWLTEEVRANWMKVTRNGETCHSCQNKTVRHWRKIRLQDTCHWCPIRMRRKLKSTSWFEKVKLG